MPVTKMYPIVRDFLQYTIQKKKQARCGPEGSRRFRLPDFQDTWHGGKVVSLTHRPPLPQGSVPGTHFRIYYKVVLRKSCVIDYVGNMLVQTAPLLTVEMLNVK